MTTWLLDTGPLVAYLDAGDPGHREVVAGLDDFSGQLATTGTLVLLAEALDVRDILTLDRRGFSTYRTRRRRSLRLVLDTSG